MKKLLTALVLVCILMSVVPVASMAKTGDVLGYAKYTDISAYINHYPIASYNINDYTAVVAEDLANYGFRVDWNDYERALYISKDNSAKRITPYVTPYKYASVAGYPSFAYLQTDIKTYVNGVPVESFNIGGKTCIYMDSLVSCGELAWVPEFRAIKLWLDGLPIKDYEALQEAPADNIISWNVEYFREPGEYTIQWGKLAPGTEYVLTIVEQRNSRHEGDIPPNDPKVYRYVDQYAHTLYLYPKRTYQISLTAYGVTLEGSIYVPSMYTEAMAATQDNLPQTKEEADAMMVKVTVPIWKMKSNGSKYSSSVTLTVHPQIAEPIRLVFEEIYNGTEKFPIKDIGAYSWRGGRTEHNWGTAIDINSNENYCIYGNGTVVGSCWAPYENPYSITPYGEVINAFEKYGFTWGGDAWSSTKDYMHFSYLGT
ncbi:MAG: M15 family metallopeptidase [Clostridia bacterium]|nr:M15 family metallopeptidase [Clostridia bacterium]